MVVQVCSDHGLAGIVSMSYTDIDPPQTQGVMRVKAKAPVNLPPRLK